MPVTATNYYRTHSSSVNRTPGRLRGVRLDRRMAANGPAATCPLDRRGGSTAPDSRKLKAIIAMPFLANGAAKTGISSASPCPYGSASGWYRVAVWGFARAVGGCCSLQEINHEAAGSGESGRTC